MSFDRLLKIISTVLNILSVALRLLPELILRSIPIPNRMPNEMEILAELLDTILVYFLQEYDTDERFSKECDLARQLHKYIRRRTWLSVE